MGIQTVWLSRPFTQCKLDLVFFALCIWMNVSAEMWGESDVCLLWAVEDFISSLLYFQLKSGWAA